MTTTKRQLVVVNRGDLHQAVVYDGDDPVVGAYSYAAAVERMSPGDVVEWTVDDALHECWPPSGGRRVG